MLNLNVLKPAKPKDLAFVNLGELAELIDTDDLVCPRYYHTLGKDKIFALIIGDADPVKVTIPISIVRHIYGDDLMMLALKKAVDHTGKPIVFQPHVLRGFILHQLMCWYTHLFDDKKNIKPIKLHQITAVTHTDQEIYLALKNELSNQSFKDLPYQQKCNVLTKIVLQIYAEKKKFVADELTNTLGLETPLMGKTDFAKAQVTAIFSWLDALEVLEQEDPPAIDFRELLTAGENFFTAALDSYMEKTPIISPSTVFKQLTSAGDNFTEKFTKALVDTFVRAKV